MFKVGSVLQLNGSPYRILKTTGTDVIMIEMGINKYHFFKCDAKTLAGIPGVKEIEDPYKSNSYMVDDEELELLKKKQDAIRVIIIALGDNFIDLERSKTCVGVNEFMAEFGITKRIVHKYIRRYLQSGCDLYSLRDARKTREYPKADIFNGPYSGGHAFADGSTRVKIPPELEKKIFEEGFRMVKLGSSLTSIVHSLNVKYFAHVILDDNGNVIDIEEAPANASISEKRFRRYCKERLGAVSLDAYRKGARERLNADRVKFGKAQTDCPHPGAIIEIDACELDVIIVGEDRRQDLGRPVCYFAIDVYSCKIVGYYVGFENNSFLGATSLFNNMFFSGERIIPDSIRVDQGSEWISDGIRQIGRELGITVTIVPPAMGSYKGIVENSFHDYQKNLRNAGREYGAIYKEYQSRHYEKACLMLDEINNDIEAFVFSFNRLIRKGYELSLDMVHNGVRAIPEELWDYGCKYLSAPRTVTAAVEGKCLFALCVPKKRNEKRLKNGHTLSRRGITINGLTYISNDSRLVELIERTHFHTGPEAYEVRIDPRTVGHIWVQIAKDIVKVPLAEKHDALSSFAGLTWFEYELMFDDMKEDRKAYMSQDRHLRMLLAAKTGFGMKNAKKSQTATGGKNSKKNIRLARTIAQQDNRRENTIGAGDVPALADTDSILLPDNLNNTHGLPEPCVSTNTKDSWDLEDFYD